MFRLLAERYDNYFAKKFDQALCNRSYTTTPEEMEQVKTLIQGEKEELFLLDTPLPTKEISRHLKLVGDEETHQVFKFTFPSPHQMADELNNLVYGKFYQSKTNPKGPTVVIFHGWMTYREEKYYSQPLGKMFLESGINYVFYSLPYHMERSPKGRLSGELTVSGDLFRTLGAFRQAVIEGRTIIHWLKEEIQIQKVGLLGISLGGWIGSHLVHLEKELDFAILMIPAVNPTTGLWQTQIALPIRRDLTKLGLDEQSYQQLFGPLDPLSYSALLDSEKILVIQANYDQCVPGDSLGQFIDQWHLSKVKRYHQGHFSIFRIKGPIREMIRFIRNQT